MARRRLTPAQPGYLAPVPESGPPEARAAPIAQVSGQSAEAAALREMQLGLQAAREEGRMVIEVPLSEIAPGYLLRDRVLLEREPLEALKASIAAHGQRIPAEVTPADPERFARETPAGELAGGSAGDRATASPAPRYGLISGWRRLQALRELHAETGEARFATLRALLRPAGEAAESYVAMVEENEIRVGLSYYERARLVSELARNGVFADHSAALRTLFPTASRAKRSKIASFIAIHDDLGQVLRFPAQIPERLGLALVARLRLGDRTRIAQHLREAAPESPETELALLEKLSRAPGRTVSRAKHVTEELRPGVVLKTRQKGEATELTLSGAGVDAALVARLRAALAAG